MIHRLRTTDLEGYKLFSVFLAVAQHGFSTTTYTVRSLVSALWPQWCRQQSAFNLPLPNAWTVLILTALPLSNIELSFPPSQSFLFHLYMRAALPSLQPSHTISSIPPRQRVQREREDVLAWRPWGGDNIHVHVSNANPGKLKQNDSKFEAILGHIATLRWVSATCYYYIFLKKKTSKGQVSMYWSSLEEEKSTIW